jgi:myosin heavy subunit
MKISSLLGEAEVGNKANLSVDRDLLYKARQKYPQYSGEQALTLYIADEMKEKDKTDLNQNKLIDTQKRENDRLRGAVNDLGQELQDFEQQSQETDREVERLKQISGRLSQGDANTQVKAKVSADDLQKLEKDLEIVKAKPGIDSEKVKKLEDEIKKATSNPAFGNQELEKLQNIVSAFKNTQAVSDDTYKKAFVQLQNTNAELAKTREELDKKEERFKNYISTKGKEVRTSSEEIKKYADIVQGYKSHIDAFDKEVKQLGKEKDIILQLRAGVQQDAQTISDMKDEISAKLELINDASRKFTGIPNQAQNDPNVSPRPGQGPNADVLGQLSKGSGTEKTITKGAEKMLGRKLAEDNSLKQIKPLIKYDNPKYDEWITKHLPALVQVFKNKYWKDLEKTDKQYSDEQIQYIIEKYTPMLYNLADEDTPLTAQQVNNWLVVVKSKLWEQPVENQLELFTESLDKTYTRMLDDIISLAYIKKG